MNIKIRIIIIFFLAISIMACNSNPEFKEPTDTATSGNIKIAVDETLMPIIDSELNVFHALYKEAHIHVIYTSEKECMDLLQKDSVKTVIVARKLNETETKSLNEKQYFPQQTKILIDAIALIVNNDNSLTALSKQQLADILSGKITNWKEVFAELNQGKIQIVFDNPNSSTLHFLRDSILKIQGFGKNIFAVKSNQEVLNYVMSNKNTIGIIGSNWCKNPKDTTNMDFTTDVKVLRMESAIKNDYTDFPDPHQSYVKQGWYPLQRNVYAINNEARSGLGRGFVAFIASDPGQRIILKSGLVPATGVVRILSFNKNKTI